MARVRLCVCGSWFVGREGQAAHPRAPGQCLHFECRGAPARVRAWRCEGRPPLPHHFVCVETFEVCINQTPLCYIIGYNILRYQALPWHISYQETVCFLGGGALYSAFSTYPTDHIRAMGISVQTLWVLVFRGVNDLPEGSFRRNDPSLTNRIPNGSNGSTKTAACSGWEDWGEPGVLVGYRAIDEPQALVPGFWSLLRKRG